MKYHAIKGDAAAAFRRMLFWAGMVACAVSCEDDELIPRTGTDGFIAFRVREGEPTVTTKTASGNGSDNSLVSLSGRVPLIIGVDTLDMTVTSESNRDCFLTESSLPLTKGKPFGSEGEDDHLSVKSFKVTAFDNQNTEYLKDVEVTVADGVGKTDKTWPEEGQLSFCAYAWSDPNAKVTDLSFKNEGGSLTGSFSYSLPEPATDGVDSTKNDPAGQPDLIFAMSPDRESSAEPVELLFHHALSAIVFKVGSFKDITTDSIHLKSISLTNMYGSGKCKMSTKTMTTEGEYKDVKYNNKDNVIFAWTPEGDRKNYMLGLNGQKPVTGEPFGNNALNGGEKAEISECTFLMIPQEIGEDSKIVLTFAMGEKGEDLYTFSTSLKEIEKLKPAGSDQAKFLSDTKYIFTLGLTGDVDVDVEDQVTSTTKSNLSIQNTGTADGYIRATIVGYWADESYNAMAPWNDNVLNPWNEATDGSFTGLPGTDWKKGDDGFYYYTKPVPHNGFTTPLFESYKLSDEAVKIHPRQKLILDIVAQIVIADKRDEAGWPTTFSEPGQP